MENTVTRQQAEGHHLVNVATFNDQKHVYDFDQTTMPWSAFAEWLCGGHDIRETKDGDMFNGSVFENLTMERTIHRVANNVTSITMLILDYDGGMTIEQAKKLFSQYEYVGYTSYRHHHPDKNYIDAFRIVLPLAKDVSQAEVRNRVRNSLIEFTGGRWTHPEHGPNYPIVDRSCFAVSRAFHLPSCSAQQEQFAQAWWNKGDFFDITSLEKDPEPKPNTFDGDVEVTDDERRRLIRSLRAVKSDYNQWVSIAFAMRGCGFTYRQFLDATNEPDSTMAATLWKNAGRSAEPKIGLLYKICKDQNTLVKPKKKKRPTTLELIARVAQYQAAREIK